MISRCKDAGRRAPAVLPRLPDVRPRLHSCYTTVVAPYLLILCFLAQPLWPWEKAVDDEAQVLAAIEAGKKALLERISSYDEIEYRTPGAELETTHVRGTVTRRLGPTIVIKPLTGGEVHIPRESVVQWTTPGHIHPEMDDLYHGGPSALAAFALVSAGVDTTNQALAMLLETLATDDTKEAGTYVHSLRACVWNALLDRPITKQNRQRYRKLLQEDANWLMRAGNADGGYTYSVNSAAGYDNSNTQFANFGLWAAAVGGVEVANKNWMAMARHWQKGQLPSGGWAYSTGPDIPRSSMTVAGCNSLYIVLDRFYSRVDQPYAVFEGARPNRAARRQMQAITKAIAMGDKFIELQPPSAEQFYGYELFGLERLGLASGRVVIGGVDWFRQYLHSATRHEWGEDPIADSFRLIFLVHGQAPILFQKLEHGKTDDDWNYYNRDLPGLTRYLSHSFERLHRWQRLPVNANLTELDDAPILYISGAGPLDLPEKTLENIREFVDLGGTIFLHADLANQKFKASAMGIFEHLFADYDQHFKPLEGTHPLYTCHFDCRANEQGRLVPLQALTDGPRLLVVLCPVDIAGAWQQDRQAKCGRMFQIMANLRVYVAPPYSKLPSRLHSTSPKGSAAALRGKLSLKRLPYAGAWKAHPNAWVRFAPGLKHRTGILLNSQAAAEAVAADDLKRFDIIHLAIRRSLKLDDDTLAALREYLKSGGLLLIDAADGQPDGIAAITPLLDSIDIGEKGILPAEHPIVTGKVPGGKPLDGLETTKAGASLAVGNTPPPILTRVLDGRVAVLACPFDLTAGVDNVFIWNRVGYEPDATARIIDNILLWRFEERASARP